MAGVAKKAEVLALEEEQKMAAALARAVELLLKAVEARMGRFTELEQHVLSKRDALQKELLAELGERLKK